MADNSPKTTAGRLAFIDWTRGLAAVIMLQGHTFNSFTRTDLRSGGPYMLSQLLGGLPPAIFLFLTGITFAFLMDSQDRKSAQAAGRGAKPESNSADLAAAGDCVVREFPKTGSGPGKIWAALKRSRYLFLLAFLFRLQMFVTGFPTSPASEIFRVDILNCMGFAMLVFAPMAVFNAHERIRLCAILGALIAALAPIMSTLDASPLPWIVRAYVFPDYNYFGFFPWAAFLAFGMAAGSLLRAIKPEEMQRAMLWTFAIGAAATMLAHYFSNLPYSVYPHSDFWLNSPGLIVIKTGFVMCILSLAYLWVNVGGGAQRWSLFRQFGTTSLLVYWVHVELVYGRWFGIWKEKMPISGVLIYTAVLIALMLLLSLIQTRSRSIGGFFNPARLPEPQRVSGD